MIEVFANGEKYVNPVKKENRFMLFCGNYRELQAIIKNNKDQFNTFGPESNEFVCNRCKTPHHNGYEGELYKNGIYFCEGCIEEREISPY